MRLLIAHKSQDQQKAIAAALRPMTDDCCEILTVGAGHDALELLLQDEPPEVALLDWDLPGIDGPELCRLVRDFHHHHDTHLIVLAGAAHGDTSEIWRAGADDCVTTPAPASELRASAGEGLRAMSAPQARDDLAGRATLEAVLTVERDEPDVARAEAQRPTLEAMLARS